MIERAARALVGDHPDRPWESLSPESQARWTEAARAVITAIREPSEVMEDKGALAGDWNRDNLTIGQEAKKVYEAMIDAMLEEG
ncbi:hypothetical protein [Sphingobium yanoikuyae]|uniref:hypothetical protein n=1 Tax=Sphingobium yanoikuyae TaxID=13690 RepID=UPI000262C036|nr:hypothetical protein [Sphingobium yanoikuyae]